MNRFVPRYSELYSISDLHLGGPPGMQMFCQGRRLQTFIESLAAKPKANEKLALVIAGDFIDGLPYLTGPGTYIAVDGAAQVLSTVMADPAFAPVFEGLRNFLNNDACELILLIGNHDLELTFPEAQEALLQKIAPTVGPRARVRFFMQGTGFRCQVGSQRVFITHGNEADVWNHVDYEALRKAAHLRALGKAFDAGAWVPNAGTKLVVDVMNKVKHDFPFIDLLKPEKEAAVNILAKLDGNAFGVFRDALPAFAKAAKASLGPHVVLGDNGQMREEEPELIRLLGSAVASVDNARPTEQSKLLERVKLYQNQKFQPEDLVSGKAETLGQIGYYWDKATVGQSEALRLALIDWVKNDQSFNLKSPDEVFQGVLSQIGLDIDVVITGHTHLPRWIQPLDRGHLIYLNTGTWARLMGLREAFLANAAAFQPIFAALQEKRIEALDQAKSGNLPLIIDATVAAHVSNDGAELVRITGLTTQDLQVIPVAITNILEWI